MAENGNQDPSSTPKADIHIIEFGSNFDVYNLVDMQKIVEEGTAPTRIFDRSDFGGDIERVTLDLHPVITSDRERAPWFNLGIQLDRTKDQRDHLPTIMGKFETKFSTRKYVAEQSTFPNTQRISTKNGLKLIAHYDKPSAKVNISNNIGYSDNVADAPKTLSVSAAAISSFSLEAQLAELGLIMIDAIDFASSDKFNNRRLRRTYNIGDRLKPLSTPAQAKAIGSAAITNTRTTEKVTVPDRMPEVGEFSVETDVTLDSIGGYEDVKAVLKDIALAFKNAETMAKWGAKKPQAVMFYGEPGTGKTMFAQALAHEIGGDFWKIDGTDINDMWHGNSEKALKDIFVRAKAVTKPTVMFLDEFDAIIGTVDQPGPGGGGAARNAVAGVFKQQMNDLAAANSNILVVAATNRIDSIDPALIRSERFDHKIYVPMPNEAARQDIISIKIGKKMLLESGDFKIFGDDIKVDKLASATDGMSGSDIESFINQILFARAMQEARGNTVEPISQEDILASIASFRRGKTD
ncbi:MAG: putative ATPase [Candidatus Saccharibacteria bacterium]|nr:putative ATPase [Candidatus Saccharibacteria bacterium]